jgi:hypothetical protein
MNASRIVLPSLIIVAGLLFSFHRNAVSRQEEAEKKAEFFAWEKTAQGEYKQVKKNYYMNEEICHNVIDVLNEMSTQKPRSNWILSHTTDSTFECRPARIYPKPYQQKYSTYSDQPSAPASQEPR